MVSSIVAMNQMPAILRIFSDWDCCLKVISCRELPAQFVIWRASVCNWFSNVRRRSYRSKPVWRSKPEGVLMGDPRLEHNSAYDHKQEIGVIDVALLGIIRRWHLRDQVSLREISRRLGISRNTVRRYLRSEAVEPVYAERNTPSALDGYALSYPLGLKQNPVNSGNNGAVCDSCMQIYVRWVLKVRMIELLPSLGSGRWLNLGRSIRRAKEHRLALQFQSAGTPDTGVDTWIVGRLSVYKS